MMKDKQEFFAKLTCLKIVADSQGPIDHSPLAHRRCIAWRPGKTNFEYYAKTT